MILVFGGTTEGKQTIEVLTTMGLPFLYSTKVNIYLNTNNQFEYRYGALNTKDLEQLVNDRKVTLMINAAHPFATELHNTVAQVGQKNKIAIWRLEREYPQKKVHPLIHYVPNYVEVLRLLEKQFTGKHLLALSGVQSIKRLMPYWKKAPTMFRILNRDSSKALAKAANFPESQLILGLPHKTVDAEVLVLKKHDIEVVLTKESGESGALSIKIEAALRLGIPLIIIEKPILSHKFIAIKNKDALIKQLQAK